MATRTIVTSQPDVACEVCARRLLRGEQPDVFVVAGRRRIVCELCAPRAAHEGWLRESENQSLTLPPMRPRRGRSLFERLPVPFRARPVAKPAGDARDPLGAAGTIDPADALALAAGPAGERAAAPYDMFDAVNGSGDAIAARATRPLPAPAVQRQPRAAEPAYTEADDREGAPEGEHPEEPSETDGQPYGDDVACWAPDTLDAALDAVEQGSQASVAAASETGSERVELVLDDQPSGYVVHAIAVFNASEFPRRVAGVTRSLGAPSVNVRSAEHLSSVVSIVVAWELCWYRYEVDLSEPVVEAQVIAQGTELAELAREDRLANAAAAESGMLVLASV